MATTNRSPVRAGADAYRRQEVVIKLVEKVPSAAKSRRTWTRDSCSSVLLPTKHTGNPNLPDGTQLNVNLAAYTEATRRAAGCIRCDVCRPLLAGRFSCSQPVDEQSHAERHSLECQRLSAKAGRDDFANALTGGTPAPIGRRSEPEYTPPLRTRTGTGTIATVQTDGNDIWGGRSTLTFVDGQSNADVPEA